jgi:outer membrane protein OmpA-like peptidoglycan-associated protein
MPEKAPGDPPSRWTVINDYSKTIVTLGAALLGFIATFSDKLQIAQAAQSSQNIILVLVIFFLVAAIGCALLVPGRLEKYLRICAAADAAAAAPGALQPGLDQVTDAEWNGRPRVILWCKIWLNFSFFSLFLAALLLASFAGCRLLKPAPQRDEMAALSGAISLLGPFSVKAQPRWVALSLTYVDKTDTYEIMVLEETTKDEFKVMVPRGNAPMSAQRTSNVEFMKQSQGKQGPPGPAGPKGDKGDKGDPGDTSILMQTLPPVLKRLFDKVSLLNIEKLSNKMSGVISLFPGSQIDINLGPRNLAPTNLQPQLSVINVSADALFAFNSATLNEGEISKLRVKDSPLPQALGENPDEVRIEGYTDYVGTDQYNLRLSMRRAQAIKEWLMKARADLRPETFKVCGHGKSEAFGRTEDERKKDRRVTITTLVQPRH